jgi:phosphoribosylformylglycinamidine cyclo-ligase
VAVDGSLLDALMAPTRIYARSILALQDAHPVHAMAHITGGGILENLPRIFSEHAPAGLAALVELDAWSRPDVFAWMQQAGNIDEDEMLRTFNCGIGFIVVVPQAVADAAVTTLRELGEAPCRIGRIVPADTQPGPTERVVG